MSSLAFFCFALLGSSSAGYFSKKNLLIRSLRYKECSTPDEHPGIVQFRDVRIASTADGDLLLSGALSSAINLSSPIQVKLKVNRYVLGVGIPLPCIMNLGSCTYSDLCEFSVSPSEPCPGALEENDVPCRCPIEEGLYILPGAQFSLPATRLAGIIAGQYTGKAHIRSNGRLLSCYQFSLQLE